MTILLFFISILMFVLAFVVGENVFLWIYQLGMLTTNGVGILTYLWYFYQEYQFIDQKLTKKISLLSFTMYLIMLMSFFAQITVSIYEYFADRLSIQLEIFYLSLLTIALMVPIWLIDWIIFKQMPIDFHTQDVTPKKSKQLSKTKNKTEVLNNSEIIQDHNPNLESLNSLENLWKNRN